MTDHLRRISKTAFLLMITGTVMNVFISYFTIPLEEESILLQLVHRAIVSALFILVLQVIIGMIYIVYMSYRQMSGEFENVKIEKTGQHAVWFDRYFASACLSAVAWMVMYNMK